MLGPSKQAVVILLVLAIHSISVLAWCTTKNLRLTHMTGRTDG